MSPEFDELIRSALESVGGSPNMFSKVRYAATGKALDVELLSGAARARGLRVLRLPDSMQVIGEGPGRLGFFQNMSWSVTALDRIASNDKDLTKRILRRRVLPVAAGSVATTLDEARALARGLEFPVVVKPVGGFGGKGVTVGVRSEDELADAWAAAVEVVGRVLVEECVTSIDVRVMVVDERAVASVLRVPAHVVGDGESSIAELVEAKNRVRRTNPYLRHSPIEVTDSARHRLAELGMTEQSVPEPGRRVFFHYKANLGAGGDSYDVSTLIHPSIAGIAERAAACFPSARHAGIDLLVERFDAPAGDQRVVVCEVNLNNDLPVHVFPLYGEPVDVADHVVALYAQQTIAQTDDDSRVHLSTTGSATPARSDVEAEMDHSARELDRRFLARELERLGYGVRFRERLILLNRMGETAVVERSGTSIFTARLSRRPDAWSRLLTDANLPVFPESASGPAAYELLLVQGRELTTLDAANVAYARCPAAELADVSHDVWQLVGSPALLAVAFSAVPTPTRHGTTHAVSAIASDPVLAPFAFPRAGEVSPVYRTVARLLTDLARQELEVDEMLR